MCTPNNVVNKRRRQERRCAGSSAWANLTRRHPSSFLPGTAPDGGHPSAATPQRSLDARSGKRPIPRRCVAHRYSATTAYTLCATHDAMQSAASVQYVLRSTCRDPRRRLAIGAREDRRNRSLVRRAGRRPEYDDPHRLLQSALPQTAAAVSSS